MCTVIVGFAQDADVPVMLAGVRDEFLARPWLPPDRHWPDRPGLVGGLDLQAGGTWLAVDPETSRAAALLNGRGVLARDEVRRSRGELPLLALTAGQPPAEPDLARYDPFHLVLAEVGGVRLWSWDGRRLTEDKPPEGVHVIVNGGRARGDGNPRAAHFRPLFAAAETGGAGPAAEAGERRWRAWRELASGAGLAADDPRALIVRRDLGERGAWGSSSVTLLGLSPHGVRYEFCPRPGDPGAWYRVLG